MFRRSGWILALVIACAPGPEGSTAIREAVSAAGDALERARTCADDLRRADPGDLRAAAPVAAVRAAAYRGTPREASALQQEIADRLESVRADAAAARSLATVAEGGAVRVAEERAVRAILGSDELCRAASTLPPQQVARRRGAP